MTWSLRDGSHEGGVGIALLDGSTDWGALGQPLTLESIDGVARWNPSGWQDEYVVGWQPGCVCGWQGRMLVRAATPGSLPSLSAVGRLGPRGIPTGVEDGPMHEAWRAHVHDRWVLDELAGRAADHAGAVARLDEGVRAARAVGSSWAAIARVVGISRQAAHQRWGRWEHYRP